MTPYKIPLAQPDLGGNEVLYVTQALMRRQLTQGAFVERFEAAFAERLGVKHAITCASGTAALHLALLAAGVKPGDRVLVPTLTYVATVAAVRYCGATPVFGDADPETWGLQHHSMVTPPNVTTIIPVHLYGVLAPSRWVGDLKVVEDCAESLGATPGGSAGNQWLATFSFYGNKILTTGEGGMVVTDDAALAAEVRLLRGQGQDPTRRYYHTRVGFNYRMTELSAAIGCAQLERLDEMLNQRWALHARYYDQGITEMLQVQTPRPGTRMAPWVMAGLLPNQSTKYSPPLHPYYRNAIMQGLAEAGIETRPTFPCVHQMPPYREYVSRLYRDEKSCGPWQAFPIAEDIARRGILLPLHSQMTLAQVDDVCDSLRRLL